MTEHRDGYSTWYHMIDRCENPKSLAYSHYGARGITVCKEWHNFNNFISDMGEPNGLTLERINNNLGYIKDNCKWATMKEQSRNRRSNRLVTYKNETMTVIEWSERYNLTHDCLSYRLSKWGVCDKAFTKRVQYKITPDSIRNEIKRLVLLGYSYSKIKSLVQISDTVIAKVRAEIMPCYPEGK